MTGSDTVVDVTDRGCEVTLEHHDKTDRKNVSGVMEKVKADEEHRSRALETPDQDEKLKKSSVKEKRRRGDADQDQTGFQPGGRNFWFTQIIKSSQQRKKKGGSKDVVVDSASPVERSLHEQALAAKTSEARIDQSEREVPNQLGRDPAVSNVESLLPENKTDDTTPYNPSHSDELMPTNSSIGVASAETKSVPIQNDTAQENSSTFFDDAAKLMAGTVASLEATGKSVKDASDAFRGSPAVQSFIATTESAGKTLYVAMEPVRDEAANLIVCPAQAIVEILEPVETEFASLVKEMVCGAAKLDLNEVTSKKSPPTTPYPVEHLLVTSPSADVRSVTSMARSRAPNHGVFQAGGNVRCATPLIPLKRGNRGAFRAGGKARSVTSATTVKAANKPRISWATPPRAGYRKPPARTAPTGRSSLNPNTIPRQPKKILPVQ
jgi:hypothetical protein